MCPMFHEGICHIAGIEPGDVECADHRYCCNENKYEACILYVIDILIEARLYKNVA